MPKVVSASEAKVLFGAMTDWAAENDDQVIVESHGKPKVVIITYEQYQEMLRLREEARRRGALERLARLAEKVRARNQYLTKEQADELASRLTREVIEEMIAEGSANYRA